MKIHRFIFVLIILFMACAAAGAQDANITVNRADLACRREGAATIKTLNIMFDKSLEIDRAEALEKSKKNKGRQDYDELKSESKINELYNSIDGVYGMKSDRFYIIKLKDAARYDLKGLRNQEPSNVRSFALMAPDLLDASEDGYFLIANGIAKAPSMTTISIGESCVDPKPTADLPEAAKPETVYGRSFWKGFKSIDKAEDANLVTNFAIDGAQGERRFLTFEVDFKPKSNSWVKFGGLLRVDPVYLKLRLGRDGDTDISTFELGTKIKHFRVFGDDARGRSNTRIDQGLNGSVVVPLEQGEKYPKDKFFPGLALELIGKLESDLRFNTINLVSDLRGGIPINVITSRRIYLRVEPFAGITLGHNIKDEAEVALAKADIRWIVRPFIGGELQFSPWRKDDVFPVILTINYTRRWPLQPEPFYYDIGDKPVFSGKTTRVRDYAKANLDFNFGKLLIPFIQYEYGREPPQYLMKDHKFKAGFKITFKYENDQN